MGNKLKHEIKTLTYHELGMKLDDQLEAAQREQAGFEGAKAALNSAKNLIEGLTANVDRELRDGTLDMEQTTLVKRWIIRAASVVQNLGIQSEVQNYQAQGKIIALRQAVKSTKALHDAEKSALDDAVKAEQGLVEEPVDPRRPDARASGEHPGDPLADRRAKTEPPTESPPVDPPAPVDTLPAPAPPEPEEGAAVMDASATSPEADQTQDEGASPSEPPPPAKSTSKPPAKKKQQRRW